jgi:hypothetical protein
MARTPVQFKGFGFGDSFELEVFKKHQDFFESVISLKDALNEITGRGGPDAPREKLIINLALMGMTDAVAIITLVGNGIGPSAMKLARSAMETAINAETLRLDPVAAEDFLEWHWVEQHRLIAWAEQNDVEILASIGGSKIDEIETNYAKVRPSRLLKNGTNLNPFLFLVRHEQDSAVTLADLNHGGSAICAFGMEGPNHEPCVAI